jgi:hypothetical protein
VTGLWQPWRRLLPVWLPAVLACVASVAVYVWLSSDSVGRAALVNDRVSELEEALAELQRTSDRAAGEREAVSSVNAELERLHDEVFGSLDERLTAILRAVGGAAREAGLFPGVYSYSWEDEKTLGLIRFQIQFNVTGEYEQIRRLLSALQASTEFLIVDRISFSGEEGAVTRELRISLAVATYLADADLEQLELLTGGQSSPRGRS